MKLEFIKINPSIKFSNKYFLDAIIDDSYRIKGIIVIMRDNLPIFKLPQLQKEDGTRFSPFLFTSKELAMEFRKLAQAEFMKHAAAGTLSFDHTKQKGLPLAPKDKPPRKSFKYDNKNSMGKRR